uniref:GDSL esterase/lipase At1g29670-like n=1 Tax=Tanacetum cinerariifolium TaxID=118510 RepID=A0A699GPF0_TANCI|nr:GDSL esterase/lipase At1g29670-like [Tanacetum cinerariifolium]
MIPIVAYSTATDEQIGKGVNYGSGGAGIRRGTGRHLGGRISLDRQLHNHNATVSRLVHGQAGNSTITNNDEYLRMCLYIVNIGSNDYINNYLRPTLYTSSHKFTPYQYATILIQQYSQQLKRLYKMGARKIVLFGLAPIGCTPTEISRYHVNDKRCVKSINDAVELFNIKLRLLVDKLNHDKHDAKFTFINVTHISLVQQVMPLPNVPCCKLKVDGQCAHTTVTCLVRELSIYYDGFHPTEFANTIIAKRSYVAISHMDASPYDISRLAQL